MTFRLDDGFIEGYRGMRPPFGFTDMAGTSLGEVTFLRTYSRLKDDGTKETWQECCQRVIEGMYEIQRRHCERYTLPWSDSKAQESAQEAYDHLFNLRWSPAGRGLWAMGTPLVMSGNSAPLQSCAFASTEVMVGAKSPGRIFGWMMEASMLGVGVGFDDKAAESAMTVHLPGASQRSEGSQSEWTYVVPDTREGWARSIELQINSFMLPDQMAVRFDYSMIRPAGSPIRAFGGTASGPAPLRALHEKVDELLTRTAEAGGHLNEENICDIGNLIGVCVVSGNIRRSSEIFLGNPKSETFLNLKNFDHEIGKRRAGWSHLSNNSARASLDEDLEHLVPLILANGEPGVVWLENAQDYGRFIDEIDGKDALVAGTNPCSEQFLENYETCCLVETFPSNCMTLAEYLRVLKFAYLYAKTVTLLPTPWPETNAVVMRNRRIGTSMSGVADFYDDLGQYALTEWMDAGYEEVQDRDDSYSKWLGIRNSIKTTTCKPSGTTSLLAGVSPGVHWQPGTKHYYRLMRVAAGDPLVACAREAGYRIEPELTDPTGTMVIYFPMERPTARGEHDVPLVEKFDLACLAQMWWSDNGVSLTLSYAKDEEELVAPLLRQARDHLKSVSFLPLSDHGYRQAPYTPATMEELESSCPFPMDLSRLYLNGTEAVGEFGCNNDTCEIK